MFQKEIRLLELIKSLSPADKKYYRSFKSNESNKTQLLLLFDIYIKNIDKNEIEIKKKALSVLTEKQYSNLKKGLFHSICDTMCFYHRNSFNHLKAYHEMMKINFLISRNLKNEAAKYANKLRGQLYKNPIQTIIQPLYGIECFVYFESNDKTKYFSVLNEHQEVNKIIDCQRELHDSREYLYAIQMGQNNRKSLTKDENKVLNEFTEYYTKKYSNNYEFKSKPAELNHLVSKYINPTLTADQKFQIGRQQNELVKNNQSFFTIDALLYSYYNTIYASFELNNPKETRRLIKELKKCSTITKAQEKIKTEQIFELELRFAAINNEYQKVVSLCSEFENLVAKGTFQFSEYFVAYVFHFLCFSNLMLENVTKNKKLIIKYSNLFSKKDFPFLFETYRILEILTLIDLKDYDTVAFQIRNAKLALKGNTELIELITLIDKLKIALENNDSQEKGALFIKIKTIYDRNFRKEKSHLIFQNFNLTNWNILNTNKPA